MAKEVILPKFGFTLEESTIVEWFVKEGDFIEKGDPLCEVTTDKVNMEVEAPKSGIVGGIQYEAGAVVPVTDIICYLLEEGEKAPTGPAPAAKPAAQEVAAAPVEPAKPAAPAGPVSATPVAQKVAADLGIDLSNVSGSGAGGKITRHDVEQAAQGGNGHGAAVPDGTVRATPAARSAAAERGIDLSRVLGTGPRGRVQEADVLAAAAQKTAPAPVAAPAYIPPSGETQIIAYEGMRQTIGTRLQASWQQAPHITFTLDVDMTRAIEFREYANSRQGPDDAKISMTAVIVKAVAWALKEHPMLNANFFEDRGEIHLLPDINVGVAVALPTGLIVPVVHNADRKGLKQVGAEVSDAVERARTNKLRAGDLTGGTFTVSNLGMFGIDQFTAIINPPEVGILAVGRTASRFVPDEAGNPVAKPLMSMTLIVDHRVVDGAVGAQFITTLRDALEEPSTILL
jgi:pyruvate dehydrogenase E2 component (dihydrolipoamide acetyltransferase)